MAPAFAFRAALSLAALTICSHAWTDALVEAARSNDLDKVKAILREGSKPNRYADDNTAALSHAVRHGNIAMARALLDAGADPNVPAEAGDPWIYRETVYVFAIKRGRKDVAELLLARGARAEDLAAHYRAQFDAMFRAGNFAAARRIAEAGWRSPPTSSGYRSTKTVRRTCGRSFAS